MTTEHDVGPEKQFVSRLLPWLIAGGAFVVYLLTLNRWVSLSSLPHVARTSGWIWQPEIYSPLFWVVSYPFHWLPAARIPLALNLFSAVCASLTLALLARSVALLPHDRTHEQREREPSLAFLLSLRGAWAPPLIAVLVCGLQLSFWEAATAASSDMLDLLLFAYVIRCVLEFRLSEQQSWLNRAALAYGLAMTSNWAMIGFFPLFLVALVWTKGLAFFNLRFLSRMLLWGGAGLLLYLVLPLVNSTRDISPAPFWLALKSNLLYQKAFVTFLPFNKNLLFHGTQPLWVLALPSLIPILAMSIRWPSYFGDPSRLGVSVTTLMLHIFHGVLLLICIWVTLDPQFSPRHYDLLAGNGILGLPLYYLAALSVGYFSGYFLLVFGAKPMGRGRQAGGSPLVNGAVLLLCGVLFVAAPAALIHRNLPQIRTTNGPMLKQYAELAAGGLTTKAAVVVSDDWRRLFLVRSVTAQKETNPDFLFLDTAWLKFPDYHRFLHKTLPKRWPEQVAKDVKTALDAKTAADDVLPLNVTLLKLMGRLAETNQVYYLHPSFGYYFELYYLDPHGLVYGLTAYPPNVLLTPALPKSQVEENEKFWTRVKKEVLPPVLKAINPSSSLPGEGLLQEILSVARLKNEPNRDAAVLGGFYSQAVDYWGVQMQKMGDLAKAAEYFSLAEALSGDNVVAQINLECNKNLQAGHRSSIQISKFVEDQFGKYRNWEQVMSENGPFDEPNFCYEQGRVFVQGGNYRQGANQFARAKMLAPENLGARLWLAQIYVMSRLPDEALKLVDEVHSQPALAEAVRTNLARLISVETSAHLAKNDVEGAEAAVQAALQQKPGDLSILATAAQVFINFGRFTNALQAIDQELKLSPESVSALVNKGYVCMQISAFDQAIAPLSRALELDTNNYSALFDRAVCYLRSDRLDESRRDYETLQKTFPTAFQIYYGLGEIAYRRKDTNSALRSYQLYLANAPTNTPESKFIANRLKELKTPSP